MDRTEAEPLKIWVENTLFVGQSEFDDSEEFLKNISHKQKGDLHLYNYGDNVLVPRNHWILTKCRGLIVDKDGNLVNYPFQRFFNHFEEEKAPIDWDTAVIQEKLDGSLICVSNYKGEWVITTRGSFYPNEEHPTESYDAWFKELFKNFDKLDKDYCYMFELVSRHNRIVTKYQEEKVYLIGMRDMGTHIERNSDYLDCYADKIGVARPRTWKASDINGVLAYFSTLPKDFEGFVVVDNSCNRVKVKSETYLKLARIKSLSKKDMFEHIIGKVPIDAEDLRSMESDFPEVKIEMEGLRTRWIAYKQHVCDVFNSIMLKHDDSRKAFALEAIKFPCKGLLFALYDKKNLDEEVNWRQVERMMQVELVV